MFDSQLLDFDEFHSAELPRRLAQGNGSVAAAAVAAKSAVSKSSASKSTTKPDRSFAWQLTDGRAATYRISPDGVEVLPGADASVVVEISPQDWSDYARELKSCFALLYTDAVKMLAGEFNHFASWEPILLAAYFGRPVYDEPPQLTDRRGAPLDLTTSFTLDDDPADISHFFQSAGFVHLRRVFSPSEVAEFSAIVDAALSSAQPDDKRSWWATKHDGSQVCCRVTYLNDRYAPIAALRDDPRLRRICDFSGEDLLPNPQRSDGYSVVVKHGEVAEGLADLPWHRDCGMGGHPVMCPGVNVGIQLDAASRDRGQLHFLAGSQHHSNLDMSVRDGWPTVAVDTEPGDVTAHFGHVMHAAPPPRRAGVGRRALYVGFKPPLLDDFVPEGQGYNDVLFRHDAGRVRSPDEVQAARG